MKLYELMYLLSILFIDLNFEFMQILLKKKICIVLKLIRILWKILPVSSIPLPVFHHCIYCPTFQSSRWCRPGTKLNVVAEGQIPKNVTNTKMHNYQVISRHHFSRKHLLFILYGGQMIMHKDICVCMY